MFAGILAFSCASAPRYEKRIVERPAGRSHTQGAKRATAYSARVTTEHNLAHITVFETSICDLIEFDIVQRIEETYEGDDLIETKDLGPRQQTVDATKTMSCDERFARVPVELSFQGEVYPLGQTSPTGELRVDLAAVIQPGTRGIAVPDWAVGVVLVGGQEVGRISMAGLSGHEQRLESLLAELSQLLGKPFLELSDLEATRAYQLHQQLLALGSNDPRVLGMQQRFVEVRTGRQGEAELQATRRNLQAWGEARELIKDLAGVLPSYVVVDIRREQPTTASFGWAQGTLLQALHTQPGLCAQLAAGTVNAALLAGEARVAASYLNYVNASAWAQLLAAACAQGR